jgi:hypothetical protein
LHYRTDLTVLYDEPIAGVLSREVATPDQWRKDQHEMAASTYQYRITNYEDMVTKVEYNVHGALHVGFKYFTSSIALNIAFLNQFTKTYLVGIDHVESDVSFQHFDSEPADPNIVLNPSIHQAFKQWVGRASQYMAIYQTNSAVKDDWPLPFIPIESLY